ncbi:MAG: DUF1080 domain-containing protein [Phycisphaera sp.]|nr:DUF1080 domain-containing protein [Phycisphaera sp.]
MHRICIAAVVMFALGLMFAGVGHAADDEAGFVSLFDGKSLDGWKASENKDSCRVEDGLLLIGGPRSHLFYDGSVGNHDFTNFEFKAEVKTTPGSNSGIYFHTEYQDGGWPAKGYEAQVNNTHTDRKKTGGLYAVQDVMDNAPAKDNEWFDYYIKVQGKTITIKINGKTTAEYTEPADGSLPNKTMPGRKLSHGTFALQAHDPKSLVYYRNIRVKPLP